MVRVKICGIRSPEDALKAINFGANAVGLLVGQRHESGDFISEERAREIAGILPIFVFPVLVTHLSRPEEIIPLAKSIGVTTIQLHGETTPLQASQIRRQVPHFRIYKAIHVKGKEESVATALSFQDAVHAILLDTANPSTNQVGGTGLTHDWGISRYIVENSPLPVFLAGGLNPGNVVEAIQTVRPYAVDINSGVKNAEGLKDYEKLRLFIEASRNHPMY